MKKKMLCLHGYSMNEAWLAEWLTPLAAMTPHVEFVIPCAPILAPEPEVRAMYQRLDMAVPERRIEEGKNWCWYRASTSKPPLYQGVEESLLMLAELFEKTPGIDGVLGWSQGGAMAAILAALKLKAGDVRFNFNWLVICGGFVPDDARFSRYFEGGLALPSLHVIGAKESPFMREQGERLAKSFIDAETLITPVGHMMPVNSMKYMNKLSLWIEQART